MNITPSKTFIFMSIGFTTGFSLAYLSPTLKDPSLDIKFWAYVAGTVIAVCALVLTVWQGRSNIKHNQLSVTPKLMLENSVQLQNFFIGLKIKNNGIGPARIKSYSVFIDDQDLDIVGAHDLHEKLSVFFNAPQINISTSHIDQNSFLPSGETWELIKADFTNQQQFFLQTWHNLTDNRLKIIVEYESLYGKEDILEDTLHR